MANRAARFGNNLCSPGYSPDERARADVAGIQIGIGIQRIQVRTGRMDSALRLYYIPCTDLRYHVLTTVLIRSVCMRPRRWCVTRIPGTSRPSRERGKSEIYGRPLFPLSLTTYQLHCIRYFKELATRSSNCEVSGDSDTIYRCGSFAADRV